MRRDRLKLVVVGDSGVGKTSLLIVYTKGLYPAEYAPQVFENYNGKLLIDDVEYAIQLWDTAGQGDTQTIRQLCYQDTNIFLMCFSIADRCSFANIEKMWVGEVREVVDKPPILLVGTKADLRDSVESPVGEPEAEALKTRIGAFAYCETSSLKCEGVREAINQGFLYATLQRQEVRRCIVQ
jgi:small GTP-binding protein